MVRAICTTQLLHSQRSVTPGSMPRFPELILFDHTPRKVLKLTFFVGMPLSLRDLVSFCRISDFVEGVYAIPRISTVDNIREIGIDSTG